MEKVSALNGIDFSPEINMVRYLQKIRTYPILSQEDEYKLAVKYQQTRDREIAKILVTSHLRLVVKVVSKYRGYGLSSAEMISEGLNKDLDLIKETIEMIERANKFKEEHELRT